ncbi:hypothetical protein NE237_014762 [Protea cynaroides]|uniref:Uncharacterized protein n=1 Tax=Protea cynaroides TaxID=273540 RepID=A0A9Q0KCX4_9MAGN|nr:hypothetical protein NE237_014762 [Protea cynaroides]
MMRGIGLLKQLGTTSVQTTAISAKVLDIPPCTALDFLELKWMIDIPCRANNRGKKCSTSYERAWEGGLTEDSIAEKIVSQKKEKTGEEGNREDQPTDLIVVTTLAKEAVTSSAGQGGVEHLDRLTFSRKDLVTIDGVDPEIGIGFEADTITAVQTSSLVQLQLNDSLSLALDGEKNSLINPSFFGSRGSGRPTRLAGHFELPFVDLTLSGDKPFSFF